MATGIVKLYDTSNELGVVTADGTGEELWVFPEGFGPGIGPLFEGQRVAFDVFERMDGRGEKNQALINVRLA